MNTSTILSGGCFTRTLYLHICKCLPVLSEICVWSYTFLALNVLPENFICMMYMFGCFIKNLCIFIHVCMFALSKISLFICVFSYFITEIFFIHTHMLACFTRNLCIYIHVCLLGWSEISLSTCMLDWILIFKILSGVEFSMKEFSVLHFSIALLQNYVFLFILFVTVTDDCFVI